MLVWLTLPFYDFCGFRSVAVNSVYKLQFFYIYLHILPIWSVNRDVRQPTGQYRRSSRTLVKRTNTNLENTGSRIDMQTHADSSSTRP